MTRTTATILAAVLTAGISLCAGCPGNDQTPPPPEVTHQVFRAPVAVAESDVTLLTEPPQPRALGVRLYAPVARPTDFGRGRFPVVLISPDANEPIGRYAWLAKHLAGQGYMSVTVAHTEGRGEVSRHRRVGELALVLDRLTTGTLPAMLEILPDPDRVAVVGHGLGGHTAMAAAGLGPSDDAGTRGLDGRVDAVIALSPPHPGEMGLLQESFAAVTVPALLVEPSDEGGPAGRSDANAPRAFESLPEGLVFEMRAPTDADEPFLGVDHENGRRASPIHHLWVGQVATAFLNATLRNDRRALGWLMEERIERFSRGRCELRHR